MLSYPYKIFNSTFILVKWWGSIAREKRYVVSAWLKNGIVANFLLALAMRVVLTIIYFNVEHLSQPEELLPLIKPYFLVSMVSVIFIMLANSFRQFVEGAQIIHANSLRGVSDVKAIMWISFVANILIAIPAGYILGFPLGMGISGIWLAYPISFVFAVTMLGLRARKIMSK